MLRTNAKLTALAISLAIFAGGVQASPEEDREAMVEYYQEQFPDVAYEEFVNGQYALNEDRRSQWESMQGFPPYEFAVDRGKTLFETPFANGNSYADCFENGGMGIRQNYPRYDEGAGKVITLELAINRCRQANGEEPLRYKKGDIAAISAYMASTSKGNEIDIEVEGEEAMAAYRDGKQFYYTRRGQLNFSCASCHVQNPGKWIRANFLSPSLGQAANFPVHRSKWGELGTLHRRFFGCNRNIRAEPLAPQSEEYRNLEYFLTYMSNGLPVVGPSTRP